MQRVLFVRLDEGESIADHGIECRALSVLLYSSS